MPVRLSVPFLELSELDSSVRDLFRRYAKWKGAAPRPPISVEEIVERFMGITFEVDDLATLLGISDVLGAAWFDDNMIRVDSSLEGKEGRFCFTLAHELGHWWLHRPLLEMERVTLPLFTREKEAKPTPAIVCRRSQKKERVELQADSFAARLLMPESDVRAAVKNIHGQDVPAIDGFRQRLDARAFDPELRDYAAEVMQEGQFTNVSNEAMRYRLVDLNLVRDGQEAQRRLI
jgi:Zn-dependent peptidase ImmA (M78 family)